MNASYLPAGRGPAVVGLQTTALVSGFPEDIVPAHWIPLEIRLDDERTLVLDPT